MRFVPKWPTEIAFLIFVLFWPVCSHAQNANEIAIAELCRNPNNLDALLTNITSPMFEFSEFNDLSLKQFSTGYLSCLLRGDKQNQIKIYNAIATTKNFDSNISGSGHVIQAIIENISTSSDDVILSIFNQARFQVPRYFIFAEKRCSAGGETYAPQVGTLGYLIYLLKYQKISEEQILRLLKLIQTQSQKFDLNAIAYPLCGGMESITGIGFFAERYLYQDPAHSPVLREILAALSQIPSIERLYLKYSETSNMPLTKGILQYAHPIENGYQGLYERMLEFKSLFSISNQELNQRDWEIFENIKHYYPNVLPGEIEFNDSVIFDTRLGLTFESRLHYSIPTELHSIHFEKDPAMYRRRLSQANRIMAILPAEYPVSERISEDWSSWDAGPVGLFDYKAFCSFDELQKIPSNETFCREVFQYFANWEKRITQDSVPIVWWIHKLKDARRSGNSPAEIRYNSFLADLKNDLIRRLDPGRVIATIRISPSGMSYLLDFDDSDTLVFLLNNKILESVQPFIYSDMRGYDDYQKDRLLHHRVLGMKKDNPLFARAFSIVYSLPSPDDQCSQDGEFLRWMAYSTLDFVFYPQDTYKKWLTTIFNADKLILERQSQCSRNNAFANNGLFLDTFSTFEGQRTYSAFSVFDNVYGPLNGEKSWVAEGLKAYAQSEDHLKRIYPLDLEYFRNHYK